MSPAGVYNHPTAVAITPIASLSGDDTNDTGVDISAYDGVLTFILDAANVSGTTPTLAVKLQHSNDSGGSPDTWTDVSGGAFTGLTDAAHTPEALHIQKNALKKYVRTYRDGGGTNPVYLASVIMLAHRKYPA